MQQKGSSPQVSKLHNILEKARTFQEIELAVNASEEEHTQSQEAVHEAQLPADLEIDLCLFPEEEVKKAKLKAGESLRERYIYESVIRASFTTKQLQQVIQTTWTIIRTSFTGWSNQLENTTCRY